MNFDPNRTRSRVLWALFLLFSLAAPLRAEPFTEADREQLWRDVRRQLTTHPRMVYHNGQTQLPKYPAFIASNEDSHWMMNVPRGGQGLQIGFATTVNFNILARRRDPNNPNEPPPRLLTADQSEEAVAAMSMFYRTLFLASASPEEWLATIGGFEMKPGTTVESLMEKIERNEPGSLKTLDAVDVKLKKLVADGKITEVDRRFTLAVLRDNIEPVPQFSPMIKTLLQMLPANHPLAEEVRQKTGNRVPVFRNAVMGDAIRHSLKYLYSERSQAANFAQLAQRRPDSPDRQVAAFRASTGGALQEASFLSKEGYARVRSVYQAGNDYYAQTGIEDPKFWDKAADLAKKQNVGLTDVYISNIPPFAEKANPGFYPRFEKLVAKVPSQSPPLVYEETQTEPPHLFTVRKLGAPIRETLDAATRGLFGLLRLCAAH